MFKFIFVDHSLLSSLCPPVAHMSLLRQSDTCTPINIPLQLSADGAPPAAYLPGAGGDDIKMLTAADG